MAVHPAPLVGSLVPAKLCTSLPDPSITSLTAANLLIGSPILSSVIIAQIEKMSS